VIEYRSICDVPFIRAATIESVAGSLLVVVEANSKDSRAWRPETLDRLILESARLVVGVEAIEDTASHFADAVRAWFRDPTNDLGDMVAVLYCAVWVSDSSVLIVHAGDVRAHVLHDGELIAVTRDHSLANAIRDIDPTCTHTDYGQPVAYYSGVTLRALSAADASYEITRVDLSGPKTVIVCSSGVHTYRDATSYIAELDWADLGQRDTDKPTRGYVGRLRHEPWPSTSASN